MAKRQHPELATPGAASGFGKNLAALHSRNPAGGQIANQRRDPKLRHLTERLHRPTGELLLELIEHHDIEADVVARLEKFAEIDPALVRRLDARDWPPAPIARVA